jgi:trk system potassium uptake protein TrkH
MSQLKTICKLIGLLLVLFSFTMLTPLIVNAIYHDGHPPAYIYSFGLTFITGLMLWYPTRHHHYELKTRDGFLIVSLFWVVICFFASLPFMLSLHPTNGLTDSLFEAVSGFTTSGGSVMPELENLPHAILFYRQQLQFLGGMGIIVLAVAVLPILGVGGMQLYRAETPGPMKDTKLTPRITGTAKALWYIYLVLTLLCIVAYYAAGMTLFDAIGESFATISTGGFNLHNNSFAYYNSTAIEMIACVFMLLGSVNFSLHFIAFQERQLRHYWQDEELRFYLLFLLGCCLLITLSLITHDVFIHQKHMAITKSLFNVISLSTTTGFTSAPFSIWPNFAPILIMLLAIIGGCAASTSGGIKIVRFLLFFKGTRREMRQLIHPSAVLNIKLGGETLSRPILQSMWGFLSIFISLFILLTLILLALDNDLLTSFSAVTATLANAGAGLGRISNNFATLSVPTKWILMAGMLLGRLEIFSILVLFSPSFWKK